MPATQLAKVLTALMLIALTGQPAAAASPQLLKLVAAMLEDASLRKRFVEKPNEVMNQYRLDATERAALLSMNPDTVKQAVNAQVGAFIAQIGNYQPAEGEFRACDEDYLPELGSAESEYPSPLPAIYRVRPLQTKVGSVSKGLELIVTGKSFDRDAALEVSPAGATEDWWPVPAEVFGTFRCSRLRAVVHDKTNHPLPAGHYRIRVRNNGTLLESPTKANPYDADFVIVN